MSSLLTRQWRSKKKLTKVGSNITSFHAAPGRRLGFWSDSNTDINFLGKFTLINVQDRTVSDMTVNLLTRFLISSFRGRIKLAASPLRALTLNLKMFCRSVDSNC